MAEYRPVLQNIAYELTMVKGLTIDQVGITQELRKSMGEVKTQLTDVEERLIHGEERLERMEGQLATILTFLKPSQVLSSLYFQITAIYCTHPQEYLPVGGCFTNQEDG